MNDSRCENVQADTHGSTFVFSVSVESNAEKRTTGSLPPKFELHSLSSEATNWCATLSVLVWLLFSGL